MSPTVLLVLTVCVLCVLVCCASLVAVFVRRSTDEADPDKPTGVGPAENVSQQADAVQEVPSADPAFRRSIGILWAGTVKTAMNGTKGVLDNFLVPNNAYVYAYLSRNRMDTRGGPPIEDADIETKLREAWGERLRFIVFAEDDDGYEPLKRLAIEGRIEGNRQRLKILPETYTSPYEADGAIVMTHTMDQYIRLRRLCDLAGDTVIRMHSRAMRMRLDVDFIKPLVLRPVSAGKLRVMSHAGGLRLTPAWYLSEIWHGESDTVVSIARAFLSSFVGWCVWPDVGTQEFTKYPYEPYIPETQFAAYLQWLRTHQEPFDLLPLSFGFRSHPRNLQIWDFTQETRPFPHDHVLKQDPNIRHVCLGLPDRYAFGVDFTGKKGTSPRKHTERSKLDPSRFTGGWE